MGETAAAPPTPARWGNVTFVSLDAGQSFEFGGKQVKVREVDGAQSRVSIDGTEATLSIARQSLPETVAGVRVFVADTRDVAGLTTDAAFPLTHAALRGDVMLGLSLPGQPLLDPDRYTFPIDRSDGYRWTMDEDSHMFAYLTPERAHEGMDLDLTGGQGTYRHRLVAIEDATVRWVRPGAPYQACILLESASQPGIYYLYQHMDRERVFVADGQTVRRGETLGHIWGDNRWAHLHFTVIAPPQAPDYDDRYQYVLNAFPAMFELWQGKLDASTPVYPRGYFRFAAPYWQNSNRQHMAAYSPVAGYGWRLGEWCPAGKVERVNVEEQRDVFWREGSALLRKTLFPGTPAAATNPDGWFEFEVNVPNGAYSVSVRCGHAYHATAQRVQVEGEALGAAELAADEFRNFPDRNVTVSDGRLTLRIHLRDDQTPAGLAVLQFSPVPAGSPTSRN